jgi:hypothetical protein
VVYVDSDDVVVAHSRLMLQDNPDAAVIHADLLDLDEILGDPATQLLIDFSQPVAVLLIAVLHFISDSERIQRIIGSLRDALAPGSFIAICQACSDAKPSLASTLQTAYTRRVSAQSAIRTREEIARFFDGFSLIDPGLVWMPEWRPEKPEDVPADPWKYWGLVGVGRKD